jgi:hypothetical protein
MMENRIIWWYVSEWQQDKVWLCQLIHIGQGTKVYLLPFSFLHGKYLAPDSDSCFPISKPLEENVYTHIFGFFTQKRQKLAPNHRGVEY